LGTLGVLVWLENRRPLRRFYPMEMVAEEYLDQRERRGQDERKVIKNKEGEIL